MTAAPAWACTVVALASSATTLVLALTQRSNSNNNLKCTSPVGEPSCGGENIYDYLDSIPGGDNDTAADDIGLGALYNLSFSNASDIHSVAVTFLDSSVLSVLQSVTGPAVFAVVFAVFQAAQTVLHAVAVAYVLLCVCPRGGMHERLRIMIHAGALLMTVPVLIAYALKETFVHIWTRPTSVRDESRVRDKLSSKTVLLTGGKMAKSLHMARALAKAGHRVILVESHKYWCCGSRFSNAVHAFEVVTCPRENGERYLSDLTRIFEKYSCDHFVPVSAPAAAVWDAKFLRGASMSDDAARNLGFSNDVCCILDDKHRFTEFCRSIGMCEKTELLVSHILQSDADTIALNTKLSESAAVTKTEGCVRGDVREQYVLKNLSYDPIHRLDLFCLPCDSSSLQAYLTKVAVDGNMISGTEPWQAQRFISDGNEYTVYAVIRNSEVLALTTSACSPSQLRYTHIEIPSCRRWVESFCEKLREHQISISGQACWDFMIGGDGIAFPLECNPRVHSQSCTFASNAELMGYADALLGIKPPKAESACCQTTIAEPELNDEVYIAWIQNEIFNRLTKLAAQLQLWLFHWLGLSGEKSAVFRYEIYNEELDAHRSFRDADFDAGDMLPFFMRNVFQPLVLLWHTFCSGNEWKKIDFAIGKVVEKNGD